MIYSFFLEWGEVVLGFELRALCTWTPSAALQSILKIWCVTLFRIAKKEKQPKYVSTDKQYTNVF
jgi:hypothetical protein